MYCHHLASSANSLLTDCEHFGDNVPNLLVSNTSEPKMY